MSVLEDVDVEWLNNLFSEEAGCQLKQPEVKHPCSKKATHTLRMRCGARPSMLACLNFVRFVERTLVPQGYQCSFCDTQVSVCWEFIPV